MPQPRPEAASAAEVETLVDEVLDRRRRERVERFKAGALRLFKTVVAIVGLLAAIITILSFFGVSP
jgi:hypothetical protein